MKMTLVVETAEKIVNKEKLINKIEELVGEDPVNRGIRELRERGNLEGSLKRAAQSLLEAKQVYLVTGFPMVSQQTVETDGLLGAIFLGRALQRLGKKIYFIHDPETLRPLWAGITEAKFPPTCIQFSNQGLGDYSSQELLKIKEESICFVAVERPGRAADTHYYTMKGVEIEPSPLSLDQFFLDFYRKISGVTTISCADGLNEIGMANVPSKLDDQNQKRIHSIVRVNHLLTAGTANWAAYGLIGALSVLTGKNLLQTKEEEEKVLKAIVEAGAIDGITGKSELTVDTLPLSKHQEIIGRIQDLI